ncbi:putative SnoaL-like aldol condensation-catalyzing enzyme|uniref:Putative SnoaL-like aldol condensation-catalyzing enzyme n=1 Tax=Brenneria salicis ATCC 15712 = DSM 30166 TaxID=714314 RepID=A0A366I593_9GAMM|nr:nuclear transport factor 2 family protein [Brenneria salicis]NMN90780.1 putative SnoaL-like aldol condensation-catalyzing enzyme [Brenneria salicis ATCC 15712 = DSM 30166]RBP63499.1 putative SnoaL-like aldol condensation-catalyzing enzyme [Brenneria salicis ATCC 15712 = DSM 30166]RLM30930.1 pyruvate kinase [Brenneria salicis ATCC 15712 = DSM 30166]
MKPRFIVIAGAFCLTMSLSACSQRQAPSPAATELTQTSQRKLVQEEKNRALVIEFYTAVLINHNVDLAYQYLSEDYIQHNPFIATGREALVTALRDYYASYPHAESRIIRTATDGNLVYLHVFAKNGPQDTGNAVVDILRVDNGKIVEHWDVVQPVPQTSANQNGMF